MNLRILVLLALLVTIFPNSAISQIGTAYFSSQINWSQTPDLYFTIHLGPANMCGDLVTTRNGNLLTAHNWICTDANGDVTAGPWTWNNTAADQTDTDVHIVWSNGSVTYATSGHVWDKTCPAVSISTATPGSFTGSASDNQWGAGFDSTWTYAEALFMDVTSEQVNPFHGEIYYWDGTGYSSFSMVSISGTVSGMPGHNATWSVAAPPASAHIRGHIYQWEIHFADGDNNCMPQIVRSTFTY
jgi:hypothetical protein